MNILDSLSWRYAVRQFSKQKLDSEVVNELVEAVRLTPSSYGLQPYKLIVVSSDKVKEQLLPFAMGQTKVRDCSHLFVLASQTSITESLIDQYFDKLESLRDLSSGSTVGFKSHVKQVMLGKSKLEQANWAEQQAYIALGNLLTVAAANKVDACPMGGFEADGFNKVLGLDTLSLHTSVICALGFRAHNDLSAEAVKVRADLQEFCVRV